MVSIQDLRALRNEIRNVCSAVAILKDAVSNGLGMSDFNNIQDNINMLIDKIEHARFEYNIHFPIFIEEVNLIIIVEI